MRYRELIEATVPTTTYGYWISQFGEIYPVGDHGHEPFIRSVENIDSATGMMTGWVRVVTKNNVLQVEACFPKLKARTRSSLMSLARSEDFSGFIIDAYTSTRQYTAYSLTLLHDFIHQVQRLYQA